MQCQTCGIDDPSLYIIGKRKICHKCMENECRRMVNDMHDVWDRQKDQDDEDYWDAQFASEEELHERTVLNRNQASGKKKRKPKK